VTAVLCPQTPLLLPEVAGRGEQVVRLREACAEAVAALLAPEPRRIAVVGPGERTERHPDPPDRVAARASVLGGLGVPVSPDGAVQLPLSLAVGGALLGALTDTLTPRRVEISWLELDPDSTPDECHRLGVELAEGHGALLVLGDGSSRRGAEPPGGTDPRAEEFDAAVAAALRDADDDALAALDPALATELGASGRPAFQVLAGWADRRTTRGRLLHDEAPFGVGYLVATWSTPTRRP